VETALRQHSVTGWNLAFSAGACALSAATVSPRFAAALALGALLEAANFRALFASCERILGAGGSAAGLAVAALGVRLVLLAVVIAVALQAGVDAAGLLVGLSLILPATLIAAWHARPPLVPDAPALPPDDPAWDLWDPTFARERAPHRADDDEEADW
jgi:hypothetical protein